MGVSHFLFCFLQQLCSFFFFLMTHGSNHVYKHQTVVAEATEELGVTNIRIVKEGVQNSNWSKYFMMSVAVLQNIDESVRQSRECARLGSYKTSLSLYGEVETLISKYADNAY